MAWDLVKILSGIIVGFFLGVIVDRDTVIKYVVRKIKIKNSENISDVVSIDTLKDQIKATRRERRAQRRTKRREGK